ncbi:MAG TPA: hypothetical protein VHE08_04535 [Solirubrobacterales bacterium]|nr:hypothetical protein [Solirubrobacterales bacterium]
MATGNDPVLSGKERPAARRVAARTKPKVEAEPEPFAEVEPGEVESAEVEPEFEEEPVEAETEFEEEAVEAEPEFVETEPEPLVTSQS